MKKLKECFVSHLTIHEKAENVADSWGIICRSIFRVVYMQFFHDCSPILVRDFENIFVVSHRFLID